jgi:transposase InsO family protein
MPGRLITTKQVKIYMTARKEGCTQVLSAAKAGISERSGREIEKGRRKAKHEVRNWKTRKDPLCGVWENELEPLLMKQPELSPITLLEMLQERDKDKHPDSILRTLQRRVKKWKALFGPEKEVIFMQEHLPGKLGLSDFTTLKNIKITIGGKELKHILYHFRLAYSGWSFMKVIFGGESYAALTEGLQEALWRLGGSPHEHRTDSLSAAFKNLSKNAQTDITEKYEVFCEHYNMLPSRNNPGISHENGSIESPHGHLKRRIRQALILRGNCDFASTEEYQDWLDGVVSQHNRRNAKAVGIDKEALQKLPDYKAIDYTELMATVTSSSTIDVRRVTYTVPSRLQGETLRIRLYHDRLACYLGTTHITDLRRVYAKGTTRVKSIDYRHVITSLARKPQAFRYSRLRDNLLPNEKYKQIWEYVNKHFESKNACKFIVGLLYIAAQKDCEETLADEVLAEITMGKTPSLSHLQNKYQCKKASSPTVHVEQHLLSSYNNLITKEVVYA